MTETQILLATAMVAGFVLLALSVAAFAAHRPRAGLALLVLSGVACVACYPLVARMSRDQEAQTRSAIEEKYGIEVTQWSGPLGDSSVWVIDGEQQICDHIDLSDRDDPVLECHVPEPGEAGGH